MPIYVIDKIKQKNNGKFSLLDAKDVVMSDGKDVETTIKEIGASGGGSGSDNTYVLPQATETELGGIKAKTKTNEDKEVAIDTSTSKLYVQGPLTTDFEGGNNIAIEKGADNKVKISTTQNLLTSDMLGMSIAPLNSEKKIDSTYLPSYVDDVIEGYLYNGQFYLEDTHATLITASASKIYIDLATNKTYRWSGSQYVEISESLALGETSSTAYAGDKGKKNADDIVVLNGKVSTIETNITTLQNDKANTSDLTNKQDTLVSGTNIKTINNQSLLGSGNIEIQGGTATVDYATNEEVIALFGGGY